MTQRILGIAGKLRSGKDTVADMLIADYGFKKLKFAEKVYEGLWEINPIIDFERIDDKYGFISFIEVRLQEVVNTFGWENCKDKYPEVRRLLQAYGTEGGREIHGENCWVDILKRQIEAEPNQNFVISDMRFKSELDMVHSIGGETLRVVRPSQASQTSTHISEAYLEDVQHEIINDGTLVDLENKVKDFMVELGWQ